MNKSYVKNAAAIMAVTLIAGLSMSVVSADSGYTHTRTLKVGSRGLAVESLQEALNACWDLGLVADGIFGRGTAAAVKEAQRDLGVRADAVVGPITGGEISDCEPMDDDSDDSDDSDDNDDDTTPTPTPTPTDTLTGPEGTISNPSKLGAYSNTKVSEGDRDVKVYGIEMTAKDGDQKIDGFNVALKQTAVVVSPNTPSNKVTRYVSEISIWLDGKEIGRKVAAAYSDDAGDTYTYRFSGMNGIIKKDMKSQLIVAITPVTSFDSIDANNEIWMIEAGTTVGGTMNTNYISAMSANGRFRDYGSDTSTSTIDFQKAGTSSSDQKYRVSTSSTNPVAQTIQVSRTSNTNGKTLLAFDVKAENGAMILQRIPVTVTTTNGGIDAVAPNPEAAINLLSLYVAGSTVPLDTVSIPSGTSTQTVTFGLNNKLGYKIASNATVKLEVRADLNDIEDTGLIVSDFDEGDKVNVSYSSTNVTSTTVELDNFSQDSVQNRSGAAVGEDQTARSTGMQVTQGAVTSTDTVSTTGLVISRTFTIPVKIKAFDDTIYIGKAVANSSAALPTALTSNIATSLGYTIENSLGATYTVAAGAGTMASASATLSSSDATQTTVTCTGVAAPVSSCTGAGSIESFRVDSGTEKTFTLVIVVSDAAEGTANNQYRIQLNKIQGFTSSNLLAAEAVAQDLNPSNAYETNYYTIATN